MNMHKFYKIIIISAILLFTNIKYCLCSTNAYYENDFGFLLEYYRKDTIEPYANYKGIICYEFINDNIFDEYIEFDKDNFLIGNFSCNDVIIYKWILINGENRFIVLNDPNFYKVYDRPFIKTDNIHIFFSEDIYNFLLEQYDSKSKVVINSDYPAIIDIDNFLLIYSNLDDNFQSIFTLTKKVDAKSLFKIKNSSLYLNNTIIDETGVIKKYKKIYVRLVDVLNIIGCDNITYKEETKELKFSFENAEYVYDIQKGLFLTELNSNSNIYLLHPKLLHNCLYVDVDSLIDFFNHIGKFKISNDSNGIKITERHQ